MSSDEYFSQYVSPNIVIIPTMSFCGEPSSKKAKIDKLTETSLVEDGEKGSKIKVVCSGTNDYNKVNKSVNNFSWASNYMQSIGQLNEIPKYNRKPANQYKPKLEEERNKPKDKTPVKHKLPKTSLFHECVKTIEATGHVKHLECSDTKQKLTSIKTNTVLKKDIKETPTSRKRVVEKIKWDYKPESTVSKVLPTSTKKLNIVHAKNEIKHASENSKLTDNSGITVKDTKVSNNKHDLLKYVSIKTDNNSNNKLKLKRKLKSSVSVRNQCKIDKGSSTHKDEHVKNKKTDKYNYNYDNKRVHKNNNYYLKNRQCEEIKKQQVVLINKSDNKKEDMHEKNKHHKKRRDDLKNFQETKKKGKETLIKTSPKRLIVKHKKIKLIINVTCKPSFESSTDTDSDRSNDYSESCTQANVDLSFLDDFNVDEIVESLIPTEESTKEYIVEKSETIKDKKDNTQTDFIAEYHCNDVIDNKEKNISDNNECNSSNIDRSVQSNIVDEKSLKTEQSEFIRIHELIKILSTRKKPEIYEEIQDAISMHNTETLHMDEIANTFNAINDTVDIKLSKLMPDGINNLVNVLESEVVSLKKTTLCQCDNLTLSNPRCTHLANVKPVKTEQKEFSMETNKPMEISGPNKQICDCDDKVRSINTDFKKESIILEDIKNISSQNNNSDSSIVHKIEDNFLIQDKDIVVDKIEVLENANKDIILYKTETSDFSVIKSYETIEKQASNEVKDLYETPVVDLTIDQIQESKLFINTKTTSSFMSETRNCEKGKVSIKKKFKSSQVKENADVTIVDLTNDKNESSDSSVIIISDIEENKKGTENENKIETKISKPLESTEALINHYSLTQTDVSLTHSKCNQSLDSTKENISELNLTTETASFMDSIKTSTEEKSTIAVNELQKENIPVENINVSTNEKHEPNNNKEICHKRTATKVISTKDRLNVQNYEKKLESRSSLTGFISKKNNLLMNILEKRMMRYLGVKYTVTSLIHCGKYSKIFSCNDTKGRFYAVKIVNCENRNRLGIEKENLLMKLQKYENQASLPLVYIYYGFGLERSWCFLMEYYPKTLQQELYNSSKSLQPSSVQILSRQLITALIVLKRNNIVHSDIKPSHILLNATNTKLKLCGFDASYYINNIILLPNIGTVRYRSPEVILGYSAGFSIDLWSAALVMYEMASGRKLFTGNYNNEILYRQMCLLGNMPYDMLQDGCYTENHFLCRVFLRKIGYKRGQSIPIPYFKAAGNIRDSIIKAYHLHWSNESNWKQQKKDIAKLNLLISLLNQMLVLHPKNRLPHEFIDVDPFIYWSLEWQD